jgi:hypothetical protein
MADFVQATVIKSATRALRDPHASLVSLKTTTDNVVLGNPWNCISYTRAGVTKNPVEINKETFSGTCVYQDTYGKVIGKITISAPTISGFNATISQILANTALETAIGGIVAHNALQDKASIVLGCCWADGDVFSVTFTRDAVRISSYSNDDILTDLETWADGISALA